MMRRLLMFERKHEKLVTPAEFRSRLLRGALAGFGMIGGSLAIGVLGYHWSGPHGWLDSLYSASMILGGMGPVAPSLHDISSAEKWFSSFYALYSGVILLASVGVLVAPVVHRFLHHFHVDVDEEQQRQ